MITTELTVNHKGALDWVKRGFPVFPCCYPDTNGNCGCGGNHEGRDIGKVPLTEHGFKDATRMQLLVRDYWTKFPNANIGIAIPDGYFVLDIDIDHGGYDSLEPLQNKVGVLPATLRILTGSSGAHLWYKYKSEVPIRNTAALAGLPGIDVRGTGGYVIAPPSIHRCGNPYSITEDCEIAQAPQALIDLCTTKKNKNFETQAAGSELIPEGQRNQTLTSMGGTMRRRGMTETAIEAALLITNKERCSPPLPDGEISQIAKSVSRYSPNGNNVYINTIYGTPRNSDINGTENGTENGTLSGQDTVANRIEEWVTNSGGRWFETPELDRDLGITSTVDKNNRRKKMLRLKESGIIEQHAKIQKQFRFINKSLNFINYKTVSTVNPLPIKFPLKIERLVNLFPNNLVVAAGSTNAGKTAFLLNVVYLNHKTFPMPIYYFCSEMGDVELRERLEQFPGMTIEEWNFKAIDRATDFEDVIVPDSLNLVDYLEMTDDLFQVNTHLTAITKKLGNGVAIVAIQKKIDAKWGRGAEFSAEKSKLYLTMDAGKITITKGKSWADKTKDPNGLTAKFTIKGGCSFETIEDWHKRQD